MWVIILLKRIKSTILILTAFAALISPINCFASVSAASAVVMDAETNMILYETNAYDERPMASTTKIMTALLACESGKLSQTVTVTDEMLLGCEGSSVGLRGGDKITLYDLTVAMLLASGNDAANAAACFLAGTLEEFASLMNQRAAEIGMNNTEFVTPSGLDSGNHHSTAYDMALLAAQALGNTAFSEICAMQKCEITISGKKQTLYNHNKLLSSLDGCIGVKTGFTEKAGRCLVSAVEYKGNTLICVTLSDPDDWDDHASLIKQCKKKYSEKRFASEMQIPVVGGKEDFVTASYEYSVITVNDEFSQRIFYYPFVYAPIKKGDTLGYVKINNKTVPLKAQEDVKIYGTE